VGAKSYRGLGDEEAEGVNQTLGWWATANDDDNYVYAIALS